MHERNIAADGASLRHERLLRATAALYRVTALLPAAEPLRTALRTAANDVLAYCIAASHGAARGSPDLEVRMSTLLGFLAVARQLTDVRPENFAVLEREYHAYLAAWVRRVPAGGRTEPEAWREAPAPADPAAPDAAVPARRISAVPKQGGANERQRAILERLSQVPRVKVSDFYEIFRDVSPKTIQRDLQDLVTRHVIRKTGEKRWTVYMLADVS